MSSTTEQDKNLWAYYQRERPDVFYSTHSRHKTVLKKVRKYVKPGGKLLEMGFGDGYLLNLLSRNYKCCGIDIDNNLIEAAKNKMDKVGFKVLKEDGRIPFSSGCFDGFIASEVLEHMTDKGLKICVNEIKRVLKEKGYAFITVPAEEDLKVNECFCPNCNTVFHRWGHQQSWNHNKIRELFKHFKIIKISDYFVRYEGSNMLEKVIGYLLFISRNIFNKFYKLPNRSYLVILKKI